MKTWSFGIDERALKFPTWQRPVLQALRAKDGVDKDRLRALVLAAETAIFTRQQAMSPHKRHDPERRAIDDAVIVLRILKKNCLDFPDWAESEDGSREVTGTSEVPPSLDQ
jgi:hypothetical protein